ncbi:MAG: lytic transglycosylase domain-containing protein [Deltaproteobacteria bacterium]|nr:lytic transglycosylase domain-containing protein [Deltaproteobacteria bacterium]
MCKHIGKGVAGLCGMLLVMGSPLTGDGVATADIRVYRGSNGVLYITNQSSRSARISATNKSSYKRNADSLRNVRAKGQRKERDGLTSNDGASPFGGRIIDVRKDLSGRWEAKRYVHDSRTTAPIHVYRNKQGTLLFTNVPNQPGYRPFLFLQPYVSRMTSKESADFDRLIRAACARYGVEFELVKAVIKAESAFNPWAISRAGARGLMQLMPETAADHGVADIHSPRQNIEGGVRHLRLLLERYDGNVTLALAAYNAGAGAVSKYNGIPPYQETQQYVRKVLRFREAYRERSTLVRPPA